MYLVYQSLVTKLSLWTMENLKLWPPALSVKLISFSSTGGLQSKGWLTPNRK